MTGLVSLIAVAVLSAAVVAYILGVKAFLRHLESVHVTEFERLGQPRFGFQFGDPRYRRAMHYIRSGAFAVLGDEVLTVLARRLRSLEYLGGSALLVLMIVAAMG
ncbi:MAG: hypothetical protein JXK05_07280 [Campylobacterales bacterium]|nr:hypothetical protein [Campylobacterales bacterium]